MLYRDRTPGMLRRYNRLSVEVGRLPSLLGREVFRSKVTSYRAGTFEDSVIFVHDVARGLAKLGSFDHKLIARIVLQDHTHNGTRAPAGLQAAHGGTMLSGGSVSAYGYFSGRGLTGAIARQDVAREKICQEGKKKESPVSDSG
jgi:hypothetical protein